MASYLELSKKLIDEYCMEEFGSHADFAHLESVGLGYTTDEETDDDLQVEVNLLIPCVQLRTNGKVTNCVFFHNDEELYDFCLGSLDFDYLMGMYFNF